MRKNKTSEYHLAKATQLIVKAGPCKSHLDNYRFIQSFEGTTLPSSIEIEPKSFCFGITKTSDLLKEIEFLAKGLASSRRPDIQRLS